MAGNITKARARRVARQSAADAAKLIAVQEKQISALKAEIEMLDMILLALMPGVAYDYIDPATGEVTRVRPYL